MTSAALNALTFGLLIVAIGGLGHGERRGLVALELVAGIAAGVLLVRRQLSLASPLLPIDLLRIPIFGLSVATSICSFAAQALAFVSLPFYFQDVLGHSQVATGLLMTPWPVMVAVIAPISGRLADRYLGGPAGRRRAGRARDRARSAGDPARRSPSGLDVGWRMAICGLGFGLFQTPNNRAMIGAAPRERSGGASGMLSTARLLGQTFGAALVALIFGLAPRTGTTLCLVVAAACAGAAALVSCLRIGGFASGRSSAAE